MYLGAGIHVEADILAQIWEKVTVNKAHVISSWTSLAMSVNPDDYLAASQNCFSIMRERERERETSFLIITMYIKENIIMNL